VTEGRTPIDRNLLLRLPKAELHCHLDGSVRPATLLELAREAGVAMPRGDARSLAEFMVVRDARNLEDYLERFEITLAVMQSADALERIAFELAEDAHRDGVTYLETRFAPVLNVRSGLTEEDVVRSVAKGLAAAEERYGIVGRVIVTALRNLDPAVSLEMAKLAAALHGAGVVGFDLAGGEAGNPASRHATAFAYAREHGVGCTCHAGEGDGAASIREAVRTCCAHRVGHGTRLFEDPALMDWVNEQRIPIEICLTSNVQTRAAASYATHPLRRYFEAGLNVVLNTDNRLMSGTSLTDEYAHAATELGFSFDELSRIALNGFQSAFVPAGARDQLLARARATIAALHVGD
jgi:adenosine deaminase